MDDELKLVVRVSTNNYMHKDKLVACKTATLLKRKSNGSLSDLIQDPYFEIIDMDFALKCDGIYELIITNQSYDAESGRCDDYDLALSLIEET